MIGMYSLSEDGQPTIQTFASVVHRLPYCTEEESRRWFQNAAHQAIQEQIAKYVSNLAHGAEPEPRDPLKLASEVIEHLTDLVDAWDDKGRALLDSWEAVKP